MKILFFYGDYWDFLNWDPVVLSPPEKPPLNNIKDSPTSPSYSRDPSPVPIPYPGYSDIESEPPTPIPTPHPSAPPTPALNNNNNAGPPFNFQNTEVIHAPTPSPTQDLITQFEDGLIGDTPEPSFGFASFSSKEEK